MLLLMPLTQIWIDYSIGQEGDDSTQACLMPDLLGQRPPRSNAFSFIVSARIKGRSPKGSKLRREFWVKDHTSSLWFQLWLELSHALGGTAPFGALHGLRAES